MARGAVENMVWMLDEAFEGNEQHSLLANLKDVGDEDWHAVPQGGSRSIFAIVVHVGLCKFVYENHAFGDGSVRWDRPERLRGISDAATGDEIVEWLRDGHRGFRGSVEALADDEELKRPRRANWGAEYETRWLISVIVEHDLYHGGEINHIRSLVQGEDRWAYEQGS